MEGLFSMLIPLSYVIKAICSYCTVKHNGINDDGFLFLDKRGVKIKGGSSIHIKHLSL